VGTQNPDVAICQQLILDLRFKDFLHGSIGFRRVEFMSAIGRFLGGEEGPTAVEYAVLLALILLVCLTGIRLLGTHASGSYSSSSSAISQAVGS
jgi:pilus assembly protein Flp/PilA